jgi:hypothetical protein
MGIHKLAQALIPVAALGVFLGLSATTVTLLKHEGLQMTWVNPVRFTLLILALSWSLRLAWRVMGQRTHVFSRRCAAWLVLLVGLGPFCGAWLLFFGVW